MPQCDEHGSDCKIGDVEVLHSNAGYYVGHSCPECGPWDRLSYYMVEEEEANKYLVNRKHHRKTIRIKYE